LLRLPTILALAAAFLVTSEALADKDSTREEPPPRSDFHRWFADAGIGFRSGAAYQETAFGREWKADLVLGPEAELAVWTGYLAEPDVLQRAGIGVGYLYMRREARDGSVEVWSRTSYQRIDVYGAYDLVWELLVAGVRLGTALTLVEVESYHGHPTAEIVDPETLDWIPAEDPDVRTRSGVDAGLLVGLGVGLALGRYMFGIDDLVELRFQSDYVRRGERDDFYIWGLLSFRPTALIHQK